MLFLSCDILNQFFCLFNSSGQTFGLASAGLRIKWLTATTAINFFGQFANNFAGVEAFLFHLFVVNDHRNAWLTLNLGGQHTKQHGHFVFELKQQVFNFFGTV